MLERPARAAGAVDSKALPPAEASGVGGTVDKHALAAGGAAKPGGAGLSVFAACFVAKPGGGTGASAKAVAAAAAAAASAAANFFVVPCPRQPRPRLRFSCCKWQNWQFSPFRQRPLK